MLGQGQLPSRACSSVSRRIVRGEVGMRASNGEALRVVYADIAKNRDGLVQLDTLGDGRHPHHVTDFVDRLNHRPVDRVFRDIAHKGTIDLQMIDWQILEIAKRGHAATEVVEREAAAELL